MVRCFVLCAVFAAGCSKEAPPSTSASAPSDAVAFGPTFALQSIVLQPPPPDGTYVADAIVVGVRGIHDLEGRFKVGGRYRLTVRVDHGEPTIIDASQ